MKNRLRMVIAGMFLAGVFLFGFGDVSLAKERDNNRADRSRQQAIKEMKRQFRATEDTLTRLLPEGVRPDRWWNDLIVVSGRFSSVASTTLPTELTLTVEWSWPAVSSSIRLHLDTDTMLVRRGWGTSSLAEFTPGDELVALVERRPAGVMHALIVKNESIQAANRNGTITAIDAAARTVTLGNGSAPAGDRARLSVVKITEQTKLFDGGGAMLQFDQLAIGQKVKVTGVLNNRLGLIVATWLVVKSPVPVPLPTPVPTPSTTVAGFIVGLDTAGRMITLATPGLISVGVSNAALITGPTGSPLSFDDLFKGNLVTVRGNANASGTIAVSVHSVRVIFYESPSLPLRLSGTIQAIESATSSMPRLHVLVANAVAEEPGTFVPLNGGANSRSMIPVYPGTLLVDAFGEPRMITDFAVGDKVSVWGWLEPSGTIYPQMVKNESIRLMMLPEAGVINTINVAALVFAFTNPAGVMHTVQVMPHTVITTPHSTAATFFDLRVGDQVSVYGVVNERLKTIVSGTVQIMSQAMSTTTSP